MDLKKPEGQCQQCSHREDCMFWKVFVEVPDKWTVTTDWCPDFVQDKEKKQ